MTITLGRNIAALRSERFLDRATSDLSKSFERLSSGMRINSASDDAAGLAVADSLRVDARVRNVALRNVNDGISMLSIIDSTLESQSQMLMRLSELAESSANGSYSDVQRIALTREYRQLVDEFGRVGDSATFNNIRAMLSERGGNSSSILFQAGVNGSSNSTLRMGLKDFGSRSGVLDFDSMMDTGVDPDSGKYTIDELSAAYGGQIISTNVTIGGKSYEIILAGHEDDLQITANGSYQGVIFDVFARASEVAGGESDPNGWEALGGMLNASFSLTDGSFVSSASQTISGHSAGNFNLGSLDLSGLKVSSSIGTNGLKNIASQQPSLIDLSGVESVTRARAALDQIKTKMDEMASYRGVVGAMQSRMRSAATLLLSSREQSLAAESRIRDVDVAEESANFVAAQIRQQASVAVLSNVRSQQRLVLQLL